MQTRTVREQPVCAHRMGASHWLWFVVLFSARFHALFSAQKSASLLRFSAPFCALLCLLRPPHPVCSAATQLGLLFAFSSARNSPLSRPLPPTSSSLHGPHSRARKTGKTDTKGNTKGPPRRTPNGPLACHSCQPLQKYTFSTLDSSVACVWPTLSSSLGAAVAD